MKTIKQIIMQRDGLTSQEADNLIADAQATFDAYMGEGDLDSAENICEEFFGLEPDYLIEFL